LVLAALANLPGDEHVESAVAAAAAAGEDNYTARTRLLLWRATGDTAHLAAAKRRLDHLVEHAPPEYRESMLTNVRVHREIVAAAKEASLG